MDAPHTAARGGHRARPSPPKASEPRFTGGSGTRDMGRNVLSGAQYRLALARRGNMPEAIGAHPLFLLFHLQHWVEPSPLSSL